MPYRRDVFAPGHYYHIYNRGAGREPLFFSQRNYAFCLRLIKRYRDEYGVGIIAYCLMPNHYHLLLRQEGEQPLSKFVNTLFNAYVQAVNREQNRTGTLFEGRFRHVWVDREEYLIHLCRYIHLNPVKANLASRPEDWAYSNYPEWIEQRAGTLVDRAFIRAFFSSPLQYHAFVTEYWDETLKYTEYERYLLD